MNSAEEKRALRKFYSEKRAALKTPEKDAAIARKFLSCFQKERNFFVYCAFRTEADTRDIIGGLIRRGVRVCVPKLAGRDMLVVPLAGDTATNRFGIEEPLCGEDTAVEIAVVPLLAADGQGFRLGYGGGYYDRYFARHKNVLRVGLGFEGQVTEKLPREETDVPLHALVTEEGIRFFPQ